MGCHITDCNYYLHYFLPKAIAFLSKIDRFKIFLLYSGQERFYFLSILLPPPFFYLSKSQMSWGVRHGLWVGEKGGKTLCMSEWQEFEEGEQHYGGLIRRGVRSTVV